MLRDRALEGHVPPRSDVILEPSHLPSFLFPVNVLSIGDLEHTFAALNSGRPWPDGIAGRGAAERQNAADLKLSMRRGSPAPIQVVRAYIDERKGRGYWDFFRLSQHLF